MNRKQFVILLVLVVVVGAAGLLIRQRNESSWQSGGAAIGQKLLPNFAVNDVAHIVIKAGTNQLNLAKRDNLWRVQERADYPANFSQISELLIKLGDLKIVQSEEVGPSQLGRFELSPATATTIEFKDQGGKTLASLLLGKKHMAKPPKNSQFSGMGDEGWPDGRYVMVGADAKNVAVISDALDSVQTKPEQWLNKDFLTIEKAKSIAVQFPEATNSWMLSRTNETAEWQLAEAQSGEKLDSGKISSVTSPFSSGSFNDVAPASAASTTSNTVVTVDTLEGFNYVVSIAPKQDDHFPVKFTVTANLSAARTPAANEKPEDKAKLDKEFKDQQAKLAEKLAREKAMASWVYELPAYSVDEILKQRHELLAEPSTNSVAPAAK
ncbi:MAG TPA: DUF4340 domain-containing protein [Verrucomicrobiae bacterium]